MYHHNAAPPSSFGAGHSRPFGAPDASSTPRGGTLPLYPNLDSRWGHPAAQAAPPVSLLGRAYSSHANVEPKDLPIPGPWLRPTQEALNVDAITTTVGMKEVAEQQEHLQAESKPEAAPGDEEEGLLVYDVDEADAHRVQGPFRDPQGYQPGTEKLSAAFQAVAVDGIVTLHLLPGVLEGAEVPSTDQQIRAAIRRFFADVGPEFPVEFDLALKVYNFLVHQAANGDVVDGTDLSQLGVCGRCVARMSDVRATNVLLSIVIGVTLVAAFLVAGLAILLLFQVTTATLNVNLIEDLGTFKDVMHLFASNIFNAEKEKHLQDVALYLGTTGVNVSFSGVIERHRESLLTTAATIAEAVGSWWLDPALDGYGDVAAVAALWVELTVNRSGVSVAAVDDVNSKLPEGQEVGLGGWADTATVATPQWLSALRYAAQCSPGPCAANDAPAITPLLAALQGRRGALQGADYRRKNVRVGYAPVSGHLGLEFKVDADLAVADQQRSLAQFVANLFPKELEGRQLLLGTLGANGSPRVLATSSECTGECVKAATEPNGPLAQALEGKAGVLDQNGGDLQSGLALAAFVPIPSTSMGLVLSMEVQPLISEILQQFVQVLDKLNAETLAGTMEVEMTINMTTNGTSQLVHLTNYSYPCLPSGCVVPQYVSLAADGCSNGVLRTTDYRDQPVIASYRCLPELNAFLSVKVDCDEVDQEGLDLVVQAINLRNDLDTGNSYEFLVSKLNKGVNATGPIGYQDFTRLTRIKYPKQCINPNCVWNRATALRSLQGGNLPVTMQAPDYRNMPITASVDYDGTIGGGVGLAMEIDTTEYMAPILSTTYYILIFSGVMVVVSALILIVVTKIMMRSMIAASEDGKQAIENEKRQYGALVTSMYPSFVVPRLLAGEKTIVTAVPNAAVFFSDVFEFTSASNTLGSEDLLLFMTYTYGLMDDIAVRFGVYKVKTVGDAYLAVCGLPGSKSKTPCLDLLRFASCIAQIFSHRFSHSAKGHILGVVAKKMVWHRRAMKGNSTSKPSQSSELDRGNIASSTAASTATETVSQSDTSASYTSATRSVARRNACQVQCLMSYGLAAGPITTGVLQGKNPMFDIWGKTVNLASRMESTGQPGRIQVAERLYKKVIGVEDQPFTFDAPHPTYCKGFGAVNSYFVASTLENPPKDLMEKLGLEPRFGNFFFDNILDKIHRQQEALEKGVERALETE